MLPLFFCSGKTASPTSKEAVYVEKIFFGHVCRKATVKPYCKLFFDVSLLFRGPEEQTCDEGP